LINSLCRGNLINRRRIWMISWINISKLFVLYSIIISLPAAQQSDTLSHSNIWFNEPFTILPDDAILLIYQMPMDAVIKGLNIPVAKWGTGDQSLFLTLHRTSFPERDDHTPYPMDVVGSNGWIGGYNMSSSTGEMALWGWYDEYSPEGTPSICTAGIDSIAFGARDPLGWRWNWMQFIPFPRMGLSWPDGFVDATLDTTNNPDLLNGGGDNWINTANHGTEPEYDAGDWVGILIQSRGDGGGDDPATGFQYINGNVIGINDPWVGLKFYRECSDDSPTGNSGWHILTWVFNVQLAVEYTTVEVESDVRLPTTMHLSQNYPNPFNPITTIRYELPERTDIRLTIFDLRGREVAVLANSVEGPGIGEVRWNAANVASGIYFYRLQSSSQTITRKLVVLK